MLFKSPLFTNQLQKTIVFFEKILVTKNKEQAVIGERVFEHWIMENRQILTRLICRKIEGLLSPTEEKIFDTWLNEDVKHRRYYEKIWNELHLRVSLSIL